MTAKVDDINNVEKYNEVDSPKDVSTNNTGSTDEIEMRELQEQQEMERTYNFQDDLKTYKDEWYYFAGIAVMMLVIIGTHHSYWFSMYLAFLTACYAAIANDSIQTIGTFLASTKRLPWWMLWLWLSGVFIGTVIYSWVTYDGDLSFERLASKGYDTSPTSFSYLQAASPFVLLLLTRLRFPVSTTFLLLGIFATEADAFVDVIIKSFQGYAIAYAMCLVFYSTFYRFIHEWVQTQGHQPIWTVLQFLVSGMLWSTWLQQDMSNIAVYLKRDVPVWDLIIFLVAVTFFLWILTYFRGDKIQRVVDTKTRVSNVAECCIMDAIYAVVLYYFKIESEIPMSTTWVFLGLISGRELGIAIENKAGPDNTIWKAVKTGAYDTIIASLGLFVSLCCVWIDKGFNF